MKKKILSLLLIFACFVFCLSGCGLGNTVDVGNDKKDPSGTTKPNPNNPNDPNNPDDPDDPENPVGPSVEDTHYIVSVYYNNVLFDPGDNEITVVWQNESNVARAVLGADGKADAGELDGTFSVYLEGLPSAYTYNPNGYTASADSRKVAILLTAIVSPISGDGGSEYVNEGCYVIRYDGTYRAKVKQANKYVHYEYKPTAAGWYSIISWVNAFKNEVNPMVQTFRGNVGWKTPDKLIDGGGFALDGGYTKNFRCDYYVDRTEVGNVFTFGVTAQTKSGEYPVEIDFAITYEGEYVSEDSDVRVISAKEAYLKASEKKPGEQFVFADLGTKYFDNSLYKFNEDTNYYHRYDATTYANDPYGYGAGYGPILCCAIKKSIPSYTVTTLYGASAVGQNGISFNYLKLYHMWIEEEQKYAVFDYTAFICGIAGGNSTRGYADVCNTDGVCYVTEELKGFLQSYAENHSLWNDGQGVSDGSPENLGYLAKKDAFWLFACGFYN